MGFSVENEVQPKSHQTGSRNNTPVNSTPTQKHLGMILDSKLSYENHLQ